MTDITSPLESSLPWNIIRKSAARLAAVQLVFQLEFIGEAAPATADLIQREALRLKATRAAGETEDDALLEPDLAFLKELVEGVRHSWQTLDTLVHSFLDDRWKPERMDPVVRAILRTGVYEILEHKDIPPKAIISEYANVAAAFFGENETGFINAMLDRIATSVRGDEMQ